MNENIIFNQINNTKIKNFKIKNILIDIALNKLPNDIILYIKEQINASLIQYHFRIFKSIKLLLYKYVDYLIIQSSIEEQINSYDDIFNPNNIKIFNLLCYINSILSTKQLKEYYWKNILAQINLGFYIFEPITKTEKKNEIIYYCSKKIYKKILNKLMIIY